MASEVKSTYEEPGSTGSPALTDASAPSPQDEKLVVSDKTTDGTAVQQNEEVKDDRPVEDVRARVSTPVWILIVATMMSSTFLFSLDNGIVAEIQPAIIDSLGGVDRLPWLGVAFVLGAVSTVIFWGKVMSVFSVKWSYVTAIIIFEVGSALCGAAPTMDAMIIGRTIAGVGGAGMYVGCLTLLSMTTTIRERPIYMASIGFTWGAGTVLGPIVGGAFAENSHTTWRWSFYINLCIGAAFAPACLFLLPTSDPQKGVPFHKRVRHLDYVGTVLSVGFLVALMTAISFGGTVFAWSSGREIALWVVTGVVFIAFCHQQKLAFLTTKANRLFPADFLRNYEMWLYFITMSCASACVFVPTYFIPLYFQFVRSDAPLKAGVRLLPFIVVMVFFGLVSGGLISKSGYYMPWYLLGGCLTLTGGSLMYTVNQDTSVARVYGFEALTGAGAGLYIQVSYAVAQAKVSPDRVADAAGFISFAQYLGITLSLAISGSVFQNVAFDRLVPLFPDQPADFVRNIITGTSGGLVQSLDPDLARKVLGAIIHAMSMTYVLVLTAGAVTVICAVLMKVGGSQQSSLAIYSLTHI
ncbi:major facilitator superfamily transporter [Xylogone sp. PMI_703]|nr:major facilitator superfamily transporter [Xylogone sp. PMI_703]